jgi:BirA family biotin operon repressor/biotin-[acetyl-CoA-carboxylase] ligase
MGVNVNVDFGTAPPLMAPATSLLAQVGSPVSRLHLLAATISGVEERYAALRAGTSFHEEWSARLATIGKDVCISSDKEQWCGLATGVDENGALLVRLPGGALQRVLAGDVTLRAHRGAACESL